MKKYALGLDYGTLSVRALLLDLQTGAEAATAVYEYPHGVMETELPDGTKLPPDFALEHPQDYLDGMETTIRQVMAEQNVLPEQIVGIGLDVTSSTVLPLDENGQPLCLTPEFSGNPHAWMKLWKHHAANELAERLTQVARQRQEPWICYYGDVVMGEFLLPKAVELAVKAPEVFEKTYLFMEAADWIVWLLTGQPSRSLSMAGTTGYYRKDSGYPDKAYFRAVCPDAENVPDKLQGKMIPMGESAGGLTELWAKRLGLMPGTPVAAGAVDAHIGVIGCGASRAGDMTTVIGTSACSMLNSVDGGPVPGIYTGADGANIPGMYGYQGSQNCVGDMLSWFVENCVPYAAYKQAEAEKVNIHTYLMEKAEKLLPGESGLMALDWFNGNRTPLMDLSLTGALVGLTIQTKPEEIYRALMESAAFGFRRVIDTFEAAGKPVRRIIAGGGIPGKNPLMMQIYADVCGRPLIISQSQQSSALGSAILGASAAGECVTGCKDIPALMEKYIRPSETVYMPNASRQAVYDKLYAQYLRLSHELAAKDSVVRELRKIKKGEVHEKVSV